MSSFTSDGRLVRDKTGQDILQGLADQREKALCGEVEGTVHGEVCQIQGVVSYLSILYESRSGTHLWVCAEVDRLLEVDAVQVQSIGQTL